MGLRLVINLIRVIYFHNIYMKKTQTPDPKVVKIYFILQKKVNFGKAIYVAGNISPLGNWAVECSLKLSWNKDDYWTGFLTIPEAQIFQDIRFKYVIADYDMPGLGQIIWEVGKLDRRIQVETGKQHIICDNSWNKEKISLNLYSDSGEPSQQYYVIGNCKQLGSWKDPKKLIPSKAEIPESIINKIHPTKELKCYNYTFEVFRGKRNLHYYYMKKSEFSQIQRHPGRKFEMDQGKNFHPKALELINKSGDTQIREICNFDELNFSKINNSIFLGAYVRDSEDLKNLKQKGVTSIISIQTEEDFASHAVSPLYIKKLCQLNEIKHYSVAIEDMNKNDFIEKSEQGLNLMKKLISAGERVYIHCSAGVYRSSQLVVLYLVTAQHFKIEQAINFVKEKHPFARPNTKIVRDTLEQLQHPREVESFGF